MQIQCKIVVHVSIQSKYIVNHQVGFWIDPYRSFGWDHSVSFSRYAYTLPCEYKKCTLCVCSMHGLFFQDSNIRSYFSMPHVSGVFARSSLLKELNLSYLAHTHARFFGDYNNLLPNTKVLPHLGTLISWSYMTSWVSQIIFQRRIFLLSSKLCPC